MPDAPAYCADLVRNTDKDRFLASLFAPAERREALHALYAFDIEVARVRDLAREPMPGEIRLQWWSDVLSGTRAGEAAANPVAAELMATVARHKLPVESLLDLVEARRFDLYDDAMATMVELEAYAVKTSSSVFSLAMCILGDGQNLDDIAKPAGIAFAIARLLSAFPQHSARRQLYVPADLMARHGAAVEDVFADKATPELYNAIAELREVAVTHQTAAGKLLSSAPPAVLPALLPLAVTRLQLDRMSSGTDPFAPPGVPPWRRQWAIWRAAKNPRRIAG